MARAYASIAGPRTWYSSLPPRLKTFALLWLPKRCCHHVVSAYRSEVFSVLRISSDVASEGAVAVFRASGALTEPTGKLGGSGEVRDCCGIPHAAAYAR